MVVGLMSCFAGVVCLRVNFVECFIGRLWIFACYLQAWRFGVILGVGCFDDGFPGWKAYF